MLISRRYLLSRSLIDSQLVPILSAFCLSISKPEMTSWTLRSMISSPSSSCIDCAFTHTAQALSLYIPLSFASSSFSFGELCWLNLSSSASWLQTLHYHHSNLCSSIDISLSQHRPSLQSLSYSTLPSIQHTANGLCSPSTRYSADLISLLRSLRSVVGIISLRILSSWIVHWWYHLFQLFFLFAHCLLLAVVFLSLVRLSLPLGKNPFPFSFDSLKFYFYFYW